MERNFLIVTFLGHALSFSLRSFFFASRRIADSWPLDFPFGISPFRIILAQSGTYILATVYAQFSRHSRRVAGECLDNYIRLCWPEAIIIADSFRNYKFLRDLAWRANVPACSLEQREGRLLRVRTLAASKVCEEREEREPEDEKRGDERGLHVKTLIGVTCSETSCRRTVPTFHGAVATLNTYKRADAPAYILPWLRARNTETKRGFLRSSSSIGFLRYRRNVPRSMERVRDTPFQLKSIGSNKRYYRGEA